MQDFFKALIGVLILLGLFLHLSLLHPLMSYANGELVVNDFAYHLLLVKHFWIGRADVYQPSVQLQALSNYFLEPVSFSMPVGMTPTVLLLWLPFIAFGKNYLTVGYTLWMTTSLLLFGYGIYRTWIMLSCRRSFLIVTMLIFASSACLGRANTTGQTTLFAVSLLLLLFYLLEARIGGRLSLGIVAVLMLLTIKPYYFLIGAPLAIISGCFMEIGVAVTIVLVVYAFLSLYAHTNLIASYLSGLAAYDQVSFFPQYNGAVNLGSADTLRGLLLPLYGEHVSFIVCDAAMIASLLLTLIVSYGLKHENRRAAKRICLVGMTGAVLLFSPFLGSYENILIIPAFYFVAFGAGPQKLSTLYFLALSLLLFLVLNSAAIVTKETVILLIFAKVSLIILLFYRARHNS